MASLGSSFIDKRQGKARAPKPPPPRRNRGNQAASAIAPPTNPSVPRASPSEPTIQSSPASRSESVGPPQQSSTNVTKDSGLPQHRHELRPSVSGASAPAAADARLSPSQTANSRIEAASPPALDAAAQQPPPPALDIANPPGLTSTTSFSPPNHGSIRSSRTTRSRTGQDTDGRLPTPASSQASTAETTKSPSRKRTHSQRSVGNGLPGAGGDRTQDSTALSQQPENEGPAKKARKIRSDKGRPRGPRASKTSTQEEPSNAATTEDATEEGATHGEGEIHGMRPTRASAKRGISEGSQSRGSDTYNRGRQVAESANATETPNGDEERPRRSRRRRATTPDDIEPDKLTSGDTMMFELGRDKKIGPVSNLEQAMRSIDWREVKQKRYEADLREMEEDLARQAAMEAENDTDQEASEAEETVTENADAEAGDQTSPVTNSTAKRKRGRKDTDGGARSRKSRRTTTTSQDIAGDTGDEDGAEEPDANVEVSDDGEGEADDAEEEAEAEEEEEEEEEEEADGAAEGTASAAGPRNPRLRVVNGEIQFDNSSLTVDRQAETAAAAEEAAAADADAIEENDLTNQINSRSFLADRRRDPRERFYMKHRQRGWTEESTAQFYEALRMFGTDFNRISKLFPGRTRMHIKRKFNREERANPTLIDEACLGGKPGGLAYFAEAVGRDVGSFKDPKVFMGQLEQEKSRQREAIEQEQREKQEEMERKRDAARQRQEQTKKDREERRRKKEEKRARQKNKNKLDNSVEEIVESAEKAVEDATEGVENAEGQVAENAENGEEEVMENAEDNEEEVVESAENDVDGIEPDVANAAEEEEDDEYGDDESEQEIIDDYGDDYFDEGGGSDID